MHSLEQLFEQVRQEKLSSLWAEAEDCCRRMIQEHPQEGYGYKALADLLAEQGDYISAVMRYKTALYLDPGSTTIRYSIGQCYLAMGLEGEAEPYLAYLKKAAGEQEDSEHNAQASDKGLFFAKLNEAYNNIDEGKLDEAYALVAELQQHDLGRDTQRLEALEFNLEIAGFFASRPLPEYDDCK